MRIGSPHCDSAALSGGEAVECEACDANGNFAGVANRAVLVRLRSCEVQRKAALLGVAGALATVAVARKPEDSYLGSYARNAREFVGGTDNVGGSP